jgi:hypothetical protein
MSENGETVNTVVDNSISVAFDKSAFDEATEAWRANKKKIGNMFYYRCCYRHSNGKRCKNPINKPKNKYLIENEATKKNSSEVFCYQHRKRIYLPEIHKWE